MPLPIKMSFLLLIFCLICGFSNMSRAEVMDQMHYRTGMVTSSLGASVGSQSGGGSVMPSFDFEYEAFRSDRKSLILHAVLAHSQVDAVTRYAFAGAGYRYYTNTRGSNEISSSPDVSVVIRPTFRSYFGWEAGLSENVVSVVTASLQSLTTAVDGGGYYGVLYQISKNVSFDAQFGMNYVFGFSSVAASGTVMKMMAGIAYTY